MSSHLRVTVVVPASSASPGLHDCLSSLFGQTFRNIEVIVVDEGSMSNGQELMNVCARINPGIIVLSSENGGRAGARMTGLHAATGTHICFIGQDDWIAPTFIEELLAACRRNRTPAAQCFSTTHITSDGAQRTEFPSSRLTGVKTIQRDCVVESTETLLWTPAVGAQLYDRSFLLKHAIAFPRHIPDFDDLAFHAQLAYFAKRFAVVAKRLHNHRIETPEPEVCEQCEKLFLHFDVFRFLETKLPPRFLDGPEYFLLKFQTHDGALAAISRQLLADYRKRTAFDLYFRPKARRAIHYIRALYKLRSKYGRRALKLYSYYLTMKHSLPDPNASGLTPHLVQ